MGRRLSREERVVVMRFSKIFAQRAVSLGNDIGQIITDHAARGLLQSGASVKRFYAAMHVQLSAAVSEGLELVSNKTNHSGRKRSIYLNHLRDQTRHAFQIYEDLLKPKVAMVGAGSGDARATAERLGTKNLQDALDLVDRYSDGLTAPKDSMWHERHPILSKILIGSALAVITTALAEFSGVLDLLR